MEVGNDGGEAGDEGVEGLGVGCWMCNMVRVERFAEGGDVADGCDEQGKFIYFVFGFVEEVEVCKSVVEDGNVVIKFYQGGKFGCEGKGEACEVSRGEHEGISVKGKYFVHDDGGGEIKGERDRV